MAGRPEPTQRNFGTVGHSFRYDEGAEPNRRQQKCRGLAEDASAEIRQSRWLSDIVLIIKSSGASGIGVHFRNFALAGGEEVYVYGPAADSIVFGPYTNKGPWGAANFGLALSLGTRSLSSSTRELMKREGFEIFEISHIFAELDWRLLFDQPDVLNCEVDASCSGDTQKNAVGRILYNDNGTFVCTGTLLNNVAQDHVPYFLTANHCVSTQAVAQTVEVFWFYQTTSCNSGVLRNWVHSPPGANLLATQPSNDFSLLRLQNNAPAGAVFSGWTLACNQQALAFSGFTIPMGMSRQPSLHSYEGPVALLRTNTNWHLASVTVIELTGQLE